MAKRTFKVTKRLTTGRSSYRKWEEWEVNDLIIGKFLSEGEDQYDKPNYLIEVVDAQFEDKKLAKKIIAGKKITLNSCGQLIKAMKKVEEGDMIQVTYQGQSVIEKGKFKGKDSHLVDVDLVEEEGLDEDYDDSGLDDDDAPEETEEEDDGDDL